MKKLLCGALLLAALALACLFSLRMWLETSYLPQFFRHTRLLGHTLALESQPRILLFPCRVALANPSWQAQPGRLDISMSATKAVLEPDLGSLLKGPLKIRQLDIHDLQISLKKDSLLKGNGAWTPVYPADPKVEIDRININGGSLHYQEGKRQFALEGLRAVARNLRQKQEMSLQCDSQAMLADPAFPGALKGNIAVTTLLRYYAPNVIFRDMSATFTITEPEILTRLTPCLMQLAGAVNLQNGQLRIGQGSLTTLFGTAQLSGATIPDKREFAGQIKWETGAGDAPKTITVESGLLIMPNGMQFNGAAASCHDIQATGNMEINFDNPARLAQLNAELGGGTLTATLAWEGKGFVLRLNGKKISLGDILTQLGLPGLSGGNSSLEATLRFQGTEASAMRKTISGNGRWLTENLELEPFGELRLLLPLLGGVSRAVPEKIEKLAITLDARNGILKFRPITATGPNFSGNGYADWRLTDNGVTGATVIRTPGLQIPIAFGGKGADLEISIQPDLLKKMP